jgi:hypothetical protein
MKQKRGGNEVGRWRGHGEDPEAGWAALFGRIIFTSQVIGDMGNQEPSAAGDKREE